MATAGAFVGDWDFVGRSPSNDQGTARFQAKNVRPTVSLPNNEVCRRIVWLHQLATEITLEEEYFGNLWASSWQNRVDSCHNKIALKWIDPSIFSLFLIRKICHLFLPEFRLCVFEV